MTIVVRMLVLRSVAARASGPLGAVESAAVYVVGDTIAGRVPARVDGEIDLMGGWVVPSFGEAHNHHFDAPAMLETINQILLQEGVFYAMSLTNWPEESHATNREDVYEQSQSGRTIAQKIPVQDEGGVHPQEGRRCDPLAQTDGWDAYLTTGPVASDEFMEGVEDLPVQERER